MSKSAQRAYEQAFRAKKQKTHSNKRKSSYFITKGDTAKEVISKLITQLALLVLVVCGVILGRELWLSLSAQKLNSSLSELYNSIVDNVTGTEILPGAQELLAINPDTVGYIKISGTEVDFPVVQTTDNDRYLTIAFDGSKNKAGSAFLDFRCVLESRKRSDNLVIYGHNQRDRTMFGSLKDYKNNLEHYSKHPTITFNSNYKADVYKIFAYFVTEVEPYQTSDGVIFDYHNYIDLSDKSRYDAFMKNIFERTQIITDVDVKYGDEFLTLSTCSGEFEPSRFVIFARKVRKGESTEVNTSAAYLNPDAHQINWNLV